MSADFAKTLKEIRLKAGYSQKEVCEHFNIPQSTFSSWETGKAEPPADMWLKLCRYYDVKDILSVFGYYGHNEYGTIQMNPPEKNLIEQSRSLDSAEKREQDIMAISTLGTRIRKAREAAGILQSELAERICVKSSDVISNWEMDINKPDSDKIVALCKTLDITPSYLLDYNGKDEADVFSESEVELIRQYRALDAERKDFVSNIIRREAEHMRLVDDLRARAESASRRALRAITYYGKLAAAGHAIDSFSDLMQGTIEVPDSPAARSADFAIGVLGDSMEPTYRDGDIVLVRKTDEIRSGEIGIFQIGNGIYIKELASDCLVSHNPKYAPIRSEESVMAIGVVLGKIEQ